MCLKYLDKVGNENYEVLNAIQRSRKIDMFESGNKMLNKNESLRLLRQLTLRDITSLRRIIKPTEY